MLIAYVALLIGCTGSTIQTDTDYKTGTGTLQLSFDSQFPPQSLMENEQSAVVVVAKNSGGYSIPSGKLLLTTDDSVFYIGTKDAFDQNSKPTNIVGLVKGSNRPFYGKSIITPTGDQQSFSFNLYSLPLPQESQRRTATITAYACFPYETFQHTSICIDQDPYKTKTSSQIKPACTAQDVSVDSGGGPVNVQTVQSRFDQTPQGDITPSFYFTIEGSTYVKLFAPGDENAFCDAQQIVAKTHDTVYFTASLSDKPLVCDGLTLVQGYSTALNPTYVVQLQDGQTKISCKTEQPIFSSVGDPLGNYLAPLTINMTYGVVSTASRSVEVTTLSQ